MEKMKVVLVNTSEKKGGAAVACLRLCNALKKRGAMVKLIVRDKQTENSDVYSIDTSAGRHHMIRLYFLWERFVIWIHNCFSKKNLFSVSIAGSGTDISDIPAIREADIIHLHWINQGFLSLADIDKLIRLGKPIVWTCHDMWPFTGICHHARECDKYQTECECCPFLRFPGRHDLSHRIFQKKEALDYGKISFVTCSRWLGQLARQATLLKSSKILPIPNPLDVSVFCPGHRMEARKQFGFSPDKYFLLFGAPKISDPRKGFEYFFQALKLLAQHYPGLNNQLELVFLGDSTLQIPLGIPYKSNFVGYISNEQDIVALYNAADLFVIPSLEENLPNTIMESMACGTPVVGFNIGGIPEMIDHRCNGYVADYKNSGDLMNGIYWALFETDYHELSESARQKVLDNYSEKIVAEKYMQLYMELCKKN